MIASRITSATQPRAIPVGAYWLAAGLVSLVLWALIIRAILTALA